MGLLSACTLENLPLDESINLDNNAQGILLYQNNCAACHQPLAVSTKKNKTAVEIDLAMKNVAAMASLSLSAQEIAAIEIALKDDTSGGNNEPEDDKKRGAMLYAKNCASCHGPLETSAKQGSSKDAIRGAVDSIASMNFLSFLNNEDYRVIALALERPPLEAKQSVPMGSRYVVMNRLNRVFRIYTEPKDSTKNELRKRYVSVYIGRYASVFGGPCNRNENYCLLGLHPSEISASMTPQPSSRRRALLTRACGKIAFSTAFIKTWLASRQFDHNMLPEERDFKKIARIIRPGIELDNATLRAFDALLSAYSREGLNALEAWQQLLKTMCSSALMEVL